MKLRWLPFAFQDIERLYEFLLEKDPNAAANAMELILEGSEQLLEMPELGRPMDDETGRRELYLPFGSAAYVLRYKLDGDVVVIIRVWHSREQRQ
ncbi:MAG: type II toxin-antitoxin system RelE/ParE family toxin [Gammaproteobacteria bacterium]|jgi:plasmid stabilization system protein ParE